MNVPSAVAATATTAIMMSNDRVLNCTSVGSGGHAEFADSWDCDMCQIPCQDQWLYICQYSVVKS